MTRSFTLFATPSFLRGMAASIDIGSTLTLYNESESSEKADYSAICSDWFVVGEDITHALDQWSITHVKQETK